MSASPETDATRAGSKRAGSRDPVLNGGTRHPQGGSGAAAADMAPPGGVEGGALFPPPTSAGAVPPPRGKGNAQSGKPERRSASNPRPRNEWAGEGGGDVARHASPASRQTQTALPGGDQAVHRSRATMRPPRLARPAMAHGGAPNLGAGGAQSFFMMNPFTSAPGMPYGVVYPHMSTSRGDRAPGDDVRDLHARVMALEATQRAAAGTGATAGSGPSQRAGSPDENSLGDGGGAAAEKGRDELVRELREKGRRGARLPLCQALSATPPR